MGVAMMPRNSVSLLTSDVQLANFILREPGIDFHLPPDGLVDVDVCCSLDIDNADAGGCLNFSKKDENVLDR